MKTKNAELEHAASQIGQLKIKLGQTQEQARTQREKVIAHGVTIEKLTKKLIKLENDKKQLQKYEDLRSHISQTMREEDAARERDTDEAQ